MRLILRALLGLAIAVPLFPIVAGAAEASGGAAPDDAAPAANERKAELRARAPDLTLGDETLPIFFTADLAQYWRTDDGAVLRASGAFAIEQGRDRLSAAAGVAWLGKDDAGRAVIDVYVEENGAATIAGLAGPPGPILYARMISVQGLVLRAPRVEQLEFPANNLLALHAFNKRYEIKSGETPPVSAEEALFAPSDIQTSADDISWKRIGDRDRVVYRGNVDLIMPTARISGDMVIIWLERDPDAKADQPRLREVYAEGAVTYVSANETVRAERLFLDAMTDEGLAINARVRVTDPKSGLALIFAAPELRQLDAERTLAPEGYVTTCDFVTPHWRIAGRNLRLIRGSPRFLSPARARALAIKRGQPPETIEKPAPEPPEDPAMAEMARRSPFAAESQVLSSRHNVVYIGSVPIFYLPYAARDIKSGGYLLSDLNVGQSSDLGYYLQTGWDVYDLGILRNKWSNLTLRMDYYTRRGFGNGLDFSYLGGNRFGYLNTYYIRDHADSDAGDIAIPGHRGRALLRHREFISDTWRADLEISYLRDRNFLATYFRREYERSKSQETNAYLRYLEDNHRFYTLLKPRLNSFDTTVERLPELGFDAIAESFAEGRLLWTSRSSLANLKRRTDDDLNLKDPNPLARADTTHELMAPLFLGPAQFAPFVNAGATGWTHRADDGKAAARLSSAYGIHSGMTFWRTYDWNCEALDVNRLRHFITPTMDYTRTWAMTKPPSWFTQLDDVDARDYEHELDVGFETRLQTKRGGPGALQSVDMMVANAKYLMFPGNRGSNATAADALQVDFLWNLNQHWILSSWGNKYNVDESRWQELRGRVECNYFQPVKLACEHSLLSLPGQPRNSISQVNIAYEPEESRWRLELESRYDFKGTGGADSNHPRNLGQALVFSRRLHEWWAVVEVEGLGPPQKGATVNLMLRPATTRASRLSF